MINGPTIIAYLGKGGSGKSILSALTGKLAIKKGLKTLFIDADPAQGLATALAIDKFKTIGQAREEIIRHTKIANTKEEKEQIPEIIDYLLLEALYETPEFSMIVMGQTDTIGCYCPINNLLRSTIKLIAENYDFVIIDAEAGFEQINRQVTESVHYPILLSDNSLRGVRTTILASDVIDRTPIISPVKKGVIFNRVHDSDKNLLEKIYESGLNYYGIVPPDNLITENDRKGMPALEISEDAESLKSLNNILIKEKILY